MKTKTLLTSTVFAISCAFISVHSFAYETFDKTTGQIEKHSNTEEVSQPVQSESTTKNKDDVSVVKNSNKKESYEYRYFDKKTGEIKKAN